ncbi:MAG: hypothetical protein KDH17_09275 [Rhodocyclaceae bacterium]|nr:hypothetical protein [Rhodocyclaceae bacterium]
MSIEDLDDIPASARTSSTFGGHRPRRIAARRGVLEAGIGTAAFRLPMPSGRADAAGGRRRWATVVITGNDDGGVFGSCARRAPSRRPPQPGVAPSDEGSGRGLFCPAVN